MENDILSKITKLILEENINFIQNEEKWIENQQSFWKKNKITKKLEYMVGNKEMDLIDKNSTLKLFNYLNSKKIINIPGDYIFELAAGNGRVTESILCKLFSKIDVLEQSDKLASNIQILQKDNKNIKTIYVKNVENFYFRRKYNIIFAERLFGNLTDSDVLSVLLKCKFNLEENGIIIIKDNINKKFTVYS